MNSPTPVQSSVESNDGAQLLADEHASRSYRRILQSTTLMGGSQVVVIAIGMVQVKVIALILGPAGLGLIGTIQSMLALLGKSAELGMVGSGVRELSSHSGELSANSFEVKAGAIRGICIFSGLIVSIITYLAAERISVLTFAGPEYAGWVRILSVTVLCANITVANSIVLRGGQRIALLAQLDIYSAAATAAIAIPIYYVWEMSGVLYVLLLSSIARAMVSSFFASKVVPLLSGRFDSQALLVVRRLLSFGLVLMWSGLLAILVTYLTKVLVTRSLGIEAVGVYQAAFTIAQLFVNFVLGAMAADFLPQLTASSEDDSQTNLLVNQQIEIGLLLSVPAIIAVFAVAPYLVSILYSNGFLDSIPIARWCLIGCLFRVASWPMGLLLVAKGRKRLLLVYESFLASFHLLLIFVLLHLSGLVGVAYAFTIFSGVHLVFMMVIGRSVSKLWPMRDTLHVAVWSTSALIIIVVASVFQYQLFTAISGMSIAVIVFFKFAERLSRKMELENKFARKVIELANVLRLGK